MDSGYDYSPVAKQPIEALDERHMITKDQWQPSIHHHMITPDQ